MQPPRRPHVLFPELLHAGLKAFVGHPQVNLSPDDSHIMASGDKLVVLSYVKEPRSRPGTKQLFQ